MHIFIGSETKKGFGVIPTPGGSQCTEVSPTLSKKGPKEGERVARGHFHERVGETPVHWLPPGVGFTQKPFSVSENGPFENFLRSYSIFI